MFILVLSRNTFRLEELKRSRTALEASSNSLEQKKADLLQSKKELEERLQNEQILLTQVCLF